MVLKTIGLKKLALKSVASKAYISGRVALSPAYQSAKERTKKYAPNPLGAGLYGTSLLATGKVAKYSYKASQLVGLTEVPLEVYTIIQKAYTSESFYLSSWKIKSRILAKNIINSPVIQRNIAEALLAEIIYTILQKNKNKQGNKDLATEITITANLKHK